jgi:hypothetical protein
VKNNEYQFDDAAIDSIERLPEKQEEAAGGRCAPRTQLSISVARRHRT